jgi:hypothetical protein
MQPVNTFPKFTRCQKQWLMPLEIGKDGQDDGSDGNGACCDFVPHGRYLLDNCDLVFCFNKESLMPLEIS